MKKLLLETGIHRDGLSLLAGQVEVIGPIPDHAKVREILRGGVHGLITSSALPVTEELMASAPLLEAVGRPGVGVDNVDLAGATNQGVLVVYTPDAPTESTAEHAVALMLALAKQVRPGDITIRAAGFKHRREYVGVELLGKTLGVVGLGRIGRRVAEICGKGLGMRVLAFDPYLTAAQAQALGVEPRAELESVVREADFLTVHTPLTEGTRGLIGARELALMKPTAYLINVARGPIVDEGALLETLRARRIAGAGLDVFDVEPIPFPHPLLELDNVVLTPHLASFTEDGNRKMGVGVAEQMLKALAGERPDFLANPPVWARGTRVKAP
ncbi:MAG: hydroxyacid dehydrogenase [Chloroflexi bacterium]|mgnify:CR=1 FL=1|nr:hydroxyacid dehydrogenase [Chloroflexota bacterium]